MSETIPPRPRWYAGAITGAAVAIAALSAAAILVDDDLADGLLGFFTGLLGAVLVGVVLWIEVGRKQAAQLRDAAALDELEPLLAASAVDRAASPTDQRAPGRPAGQAGEQ